MAGEKGFLYEETINKLLKKAKIQDSSFRPAAADSNAPDGIFNYKGKEYKLEIKLDPKADFGQGSLDYDLKKGKWILGGANTPSAQAMRELLTAVRVPQLVNKAWGKFGPPRRFTVPLNKYKQQDVDFDYKHFRDVKVPVSSDAIANYYATKKTFYIQIGNGYGLYYMDSDPAKLECTKFNPSVMLRIRLKRGGSQPLYNYRFTTALLVTHISKSNMDLENSEDLQAIAARAGAMK